MYGAEEVTTGASNDLQQVRNIARRMVAQWGFSKDSLSPTAWEPAESPGMFAGAAPASNHAADAFFLRYEVVGVFFFNFEVIRTASRPGAESTGETPSMVVLDAV